MKIPAKAIESFPDWLRLWLMLTQGIESPSDTPVEATGSDLQGTDARIEAETDKSSWVN